MWHRVNSAPVCVECLQSSCCSPCQPVEIPKSHLFTPCPPKPLVNSFLSVIISVNKREQKGLLLMELFSSFLIHLRLFTLVAMDFRGFFYYSRSQVLVCFCMREYLCVHLFFLFSSKMMYFQPAMKQIVNVSEKQNL